MKKRNVLLAFGLCAGLALSACGGSESGAKTKNAALSKPAVAAAGDCSDGQMTEGEDADDCTITVKVGTSNRKAVLESFNTDGWDNVGSVIAKKGVAKFDLAATDDDGIWLDGEYTFRVHALKSGKSAEVISQEFDVTYTSSAAADDSSAMDDTADSGSSPEMQAAMDDIEKPATKFDDFCTKSFNKIDCGLMFRPGKGPDFVTLGKDKWVKMCTTLLKRPAADCEMEYKFATSGGPNGGQPGKQGQDGTMNPGPGLDPAKVSAACAAIGMAEADCRAALQAGPMVALQKFGAKAETFCNTYGGTSCADLMAKMVPAGGGAQQPGMNGGNAQQPGTAGQPQQPGMNGGNAQQPQQPQQNTGGNGPSNDKVKAACATAGISDADCSKLMAANTAGSTMKPRDIIMSWGVDKAEKFCQAIAQKPCATALK